MKKRVIALALAAFLLVSVTWAEGGDAANEDTAEGGRYKLYQAKIDDKEVPLLLDSKTGKMWSYQIETGSGKKVFLGMTVEGVAYSRKDIEQFDTNMDQWQFDGVVDKTIPGLKPRLLEDFSYYLESAKARKANEEMKARMKR